MNFSLKRPKMIKDAENTFHLIKTENKFLGLILEAVLAIVVFFIVQSVFSIIASMAAGMLYGITHFAEISQLANSGSVDVNAIGNGAMSWDFFTPITLIFEVIMTILVLLIAKFYQRRKISTLGFVKKNAVSQYLLGMVLGFVLFSLAILFCVVTGSVKVSYDPSTFKPLLFAIYFIGWLFQGMAEEVICRGFILVSVARKHSLATAIIGNSLFFAALHLGNAGIAPLAFINLMLFGIFASIVFVKSGNIWLVSAMHSIWNMVQGNLYGVLVSGGDAGTTILTTVGVQSHGLINGADFGLEGGLAVTLVYVIGIIVALTFPSIKKNIEKEENA